jgi:hypothetical protein
MRLEVRVVLSNSSRALSFSFRHFLDLSMTNLAAAQYLVLGLTTTVSELPTIFHLSLPAHRRTSLLVNSPPPSLQ